jgi:Ca2+-binding RTX toxin-like protein
LLGESDLKGEEVKRIRRIAILATAALVLTLIVAAAAYAATLVGTNGSNALIGTRGPDTIYGLNGFDVLEGKSGTDELYAGKDPDEAYGAKAADYLVGGSGRDQLYSGRGNDIIEAADGRRDDVVCDSGKADSATVDDDDRIFGGCEIVNGQPAAKQYLVTGCPCTCCRGFFIHRTSVLLLAFIHPR